MPTEEPTPHRLLAIRVRHRVDAPTLARIDIQADDGDHSFLVTRQILEMIATRCSAEAEQMPRPSDLS